MAKTSATRQPVRQIAPKGTKPAAPQTPSFDGVEETAPDGRTVKRFANKVGTHTKECPDCHAWVGNPTRQCVCGHVFSTGNGKGTRRRKAGGSAGFLLTPEAIKAVQAGTTYLQGFDEPTAALEALLAVRAIVQASGSLDNAITLIRTLGNLPEEAEEAEAEEGSEEDQSD